MPAARRVVLTSSFAAVGYSPKPDAEVHRGGPLAERVPTEEAPGDELPDLVIHNDRAGNELGWQPRPAETTIVEPAESLRDLGLLEKR